jgi:hypothetical protein
LIELRSSCREFVESLQTDTATALAKDAAGSTTPTVPVGNPKDTGVTLPSPPDSTKDAGATPPPPAESVERIAEEQVQQGTLELKDERPIVVWLSAALLCTLAALTALLGTVIYLFIRWRNAGQSTVAVSLPRMNSEVGIEGPLETPIGKNELVMPLADRMIPDQIGQGTATSMRQNSDYTRNVETTSEVALPNTVSIESSAMDSSAVENVAQLAKLYAMGTPSEQEFQLLKNLITQGDFQQSKVA